MKQVGFYITKNGKPDPDPFSIHDLTPDDEAAGYAAKQLFARADDQDQEEIAILEKLIATMGGHSVVIVRKGVGRLLGWNPGYRGGQSVAIRDLVNMVLDA